MKNSTQIIGLPIISIIDGTEVGKVKSLVVNPDKGTVDFLTIDHEDWQVSIRAIPYKKTVGIGEYAVTVANENAIIDLNEIPIANQLVNKKIKIINTKVITRKGELLGEVVEYFLDEENGQIIGVKMAVQDKEVVLSSKMVLTFGRDIIIVNDDAPLNYFNSTEDLMNENVGQIENDFVQKATDNIDVALKEKQIQLLDGKRVTKTILDVLGNVLFEEGLILHAEDIIKVQNEHPSIIVELSMNVEA